MNSIRKKLLRWLLIGQLIAIVTSSGLTFFYVRGELANLFDDRLRQLAYSVSATGEFLPPPLTSLQDNDDDFVIQVWRGDGSLLTNINRKEGAPNLAEEGFSTHLSNKMLWRSFVLRRGDRLIQTSQPYSDRLEMSTGIALGAVAPVIVLVFVLGILVWVSVGLGLRPLKEITRALGLRRPYALTPLLMQDAPEEIKPLIDALNDLLKRLGEALDGQRKFIADAAHELRTPLAAVQLQAQLLERVSSVEKKTAALEQIRAGTSRASHLVTQLLTLARMEPEDWQRPFTRVDLSALMKSVVTDHSSAALNRQIDLGVGRDEALFIKGDTESLRIMLGNLVDNAVRYTPEGGRVDVTLSRFENFAQFEIQDNGQGIPDAERVQVFARFYRRPGTSELGSGLGLAIVQEVVTRHHGEITLADAEQQNGLRVLVRLPLDTEFT
ncbi:ATP-binding protein [Geopsychrobacter electrodiphilus]|uniref:ATP-binding protein n=1 Tax=Geopsychrobacter electrodiphilus TaxID=225196 RepID=UPI00037C87FD|nr:ATP-binding protein [Geopsychrobacter electrodiphilus]